MILIITPWLNNTAGSQFSYLSAYSYDLNGNLTTLNRNIESGSVIDLLGYNYEDGLENNLLTQVTDGVVGDLGVKDGQALDNYQYDKAGNLVKNKQEKTNIIWNHYGKVNTVFHDDRDANGTGNMYTTNFLYDATGNRRLKNVGTSTFQAGQSTGYSVIATFYVRDAQGNIISIYEADASPSATPPTAKWKEVALYGSSRLGTVDPNFSYIPNVAASLPDNPIFISENLQLSLGRKRYEITNHLGNVMATLSDRREPIDVDNVGIADYYEPVVLSATDYYPFGMDMPGRTYQSGDYRYGFNGKEQDTNGEWDDLTHYDYGFRIYNPGIGRFLSVDPLTKSYPYYTPYQFAGNKPIMAIDLDGLEEYYIINSITVGRDFIAALKSRGKDLIPRFG